MKNHNFHAILKEMGDLHDLKNKDYGQSHDPYANVRGSTEWGIPAWKGAMVRANDKIKRLQKFAKTGELANESVEDSFKDLAVYTIIALDLYRQEMESESKKRQEELQEKTRQVLHLQDKIAHMGDPGDESKAIRPGIDFPN